MVDIKRMKVLMFGLDRSMLDPGSRPFRRIAAYAALLDELHIIVPASRSSPVPLVSQGNITVHPVRFRFRAAYFFRAASLGIRIVRERDFSPASDRITAQDPFLAGFPAYFASRRTGIPLELQAHIDFFNPRFFCESPVQFAQYCAGRFLYPRADGVRAVSGEIGRYMIGRLRIPPDRVAVIPVFTDCAAIAAAPVRASLRAAFPDFSFISFVPARLVPQKNIHMIIRAVRLALPHCPGLGLVITGQGPSGPSLLRAARGIERSVVFLPWSSETVSHYKTCDCFILASRYEGWGMTVVEAMAAGAPVVATAVGCVPDLVSDGVHGRIIAQNDAHALAGVIRDLYGDASLRARLGSAASAAAARLVPRTPSEHARAVVGALARIGWHF